MKKVLVTYHYTDDHRAICENCVELSVSDEVAEELIREYDPNRSNANFSRLLEIIMRLVILQGGRYGNIVDVREA